MIGNPQTESLLVVLGAIPGAWLRFRMVERLTPLLPRRHWATLGVNLVASFSLGLLVVVLSSGDDQRDRPLLLLLATGFCGSLSTFSTWVAELWQQIEAGDWAEAMRLGLACLGLGLGALLVGMLVGQLGLGGPA